MSLSTARICGKCLKPMPCPDAIARDKAWEEDPNIPESVKQFIRAFAVLKAA